MLVRSIALLSAICFALSSQLAVAADDIVIFEDLHNACTKSSELCQLTCQGNAACINQCDLTWLRCTDGIDEAESVRPGVSPPAEIRTGAGLCLDVHAPQIATNGGRVQAWGCHGQPQQTWTYDPAKRAIRVASGLCLDVHAPQMTANGGRVQVWTCNGAAQQQWTPLPSGALRNAGGLCLDVHAADQTKNGARVQVWQCNGALQQRFRFARVPGPTAVRPGQTPPLSTN